jgi:hypothetical protein
LAKKGRKFTEEHRKNISLAKKGQKRTPEDIKEVIEGFEHFVLYLNLSVYSPERDEVKHLRVANIVPRF